MDHLTRFGLAVILLALIALPQTAPAQPAEADGLGQTLPPAATPTPTRPPSSAPAPAATPTPSRGRQVTSPRIVGGQAAADGQFPWAVSLRITLSDGTYLCGGTLVDPNWVMTASHCVYDDAAGSYALPSAFQVFIGRLDRTNSAQGETRSVTQVLHHPQYDPSNYDYDVALLKLNTPSFVTPLTLLTPQNAATLTAANTPATTLGWGTLTENGSCCPTTLQYVNIHVLADSGCSNYGTDFLPSMLCAGETAGGKDSCQGDSGGPLIVFDTPNNRWVQVGVVSNGLGCARANYPGIYSRLSFLLNFVNAAIGLPVGNLGNLKFVTPTRVLDTRATAGSVVTTGYTPKGAPISAGQLAANGTTRYRIGGQGFGALSIPPDATGVLLNVTLIQGQASGGFVTVYAGDAPTPPNSSTVNPSTGIAANFTVTLLGSDGTIAVTSIGAARNVAIDLVGYYALTNPAGPGNLKFTAPVRVLDTRPTDANGNVTTTGFDQGGAQIAAGPLTAGQTRRFTLAGKTFGGTTFPAGVAGILAHVTIIQAGGGSGGFVTLLPGDATGTPSASTVNPTAGIAFNSWANGIPTAGANAGQFALYSTNALDVAVDVVGYFAASNGAGDGAPSLITPIRVVDTRPNDGIAGIVTTGFNVAGTPITAAKLQDRSTTLFKVGGQTFAGGVVPADVKGGLVNVTIVQPAPGGGFLTVFPGNQLPPNASTVNPTQPVSASFWATGIGTNGTIGVYSLGDPRDLIVDLLGYYR